MTDIAITQTFNNPRMVIEQIGLFINCVADSLDEDRWHKQHAMLMLALTYLGGLDKALQTDSEPF